MRRCGLGILWGIELVASFSEKRFSHVKSSEAARKSSKKCTEVLIRGGLGAPH